MASSDVVVGSVNDRLLEVDEFRNRNMDCGSSSLYADTEGYQSSGERPEDDRSSSAETVNTSTTTKDADYFEERYRVDRRKLEQMIQGELLSSVSEVLKPVSESCAFN